MKLAERIHLVASGQFGIGLTDDYDCHVYLLDGGAEYALIDAGGGRDTAGLLQQVANDGLDPARIRTLLLTHAHADHAAGAAALRARLDLRVMASAPAARYLREGDERAISLDVARRAGAYPADFTFPACQADEELDEGAVVPVGDLEPQAIETPGHASGHLSYVLRRPGCGPRSSAATRSSSAARSSCKTSGIARSRSRRGASDGWPSCRRTASSPAT